MKTKTIEEARVEAKRPIEATLSESRKKKPLAPALADVTRPAPTETVLEAGVLPTNIPVRHDYPTVEFLDKKERARQAKRKKDKVYVEYSVEGDYPNAEMPINKGYWNHKVLLGTPTTGVVRMEWVLARYGQVIPTNWSMMDSYMSLPLLFAPMRYLEQDISLGQKEEEETCMMDSYMSLPLLFAPMRYLVPDAQNLIVKNVLERKVEWLFLVEQDNVLPPDCFLKMNEYMRKADIPIISGLYFTKSVPPEPMIYRGLGNSFYRDWKLGERVWCTGVPTGCIIIHSSILQALWDESPEYAIQGTVTRRVFEAPAEVWLDPQTGGYRTNSGTSDLAFCKRIMQDDIFTKAGWPEFQKMENPFLVDTNIFVKHIDNDGRMFPLEIPEEYLPAVMPRDNH